MTRDTIVETALRITRRDGADPGLPLTGKTLGDALGADRSAVWRHFDDKDDLLLTVADALLAPVTTEVDPTAAPGERLRQVWQVSCTAFEAHPHVAAELICRSLAGPNAMVGIDLVLGAFVELGLPPARAALAYRGFIDMLLAHTALEASFSLLDTHQQQHDDVRTEVALRRLDPATHPHARALVPEIMAVRSEDVGTLLLEAFVAGVLAMHDGPAGPPDPRP